MTPVKCDFCSDRPVRWSYPARDASLPGTNPEHVSVGAWAACEPCGQLIEANNRLGLVRRSLEHFAATAAAGLMHRAEYEFTLVGIQALFWANRTGPRTPYTEDR